MHCEQNDLISVIVPVYNAHDYLEKCIGSIIGQTYKNLEIILVDDGSKDDSLEICKRYAASDPRVIIIHKENGGQASARNKGLDIATGDFIGFVDNDDWLYPEMYERLHELLVFYKADIARCDDITDIKDKDKESTEVDIDSADSFFEKIFCDILGGHVTDRLFRKDVIGENRFPESKTIEDMRFMRILLQNIHTEVHTKEKLYFYTIREDNTSFKYADNHVNAYERAEEYQSRFYEAEEKYPYLSEILLVKSVQAGCGAMRLLLKEKLKESVEYKKMQAFMKKNKSRIMRCREIGLKYKAFIIIQ